LVGAVFFEGFNATVLAYGQTASGKTYTMGSSSSLHLAEEEYGIIARVVEDIFLHIQRIEASDSNNTYKLRVQYLELYGEELKDLLDPFSGDRIAIRETPSGEMYLSGVREEQVTSAKEVMRLVEKGSMARTTGSTRMNQSSSRSHAIFTVMLEHSIHHPLSSDISDNFGNCDTDSLDKTATVISGNLNRDGPEIRRCKFHFVDLAGSERAKRTGAHGVRMKESIDINKGLLVLGNVISALGGETKRAHVPYRDSKLTRILQDSLGGNSKTVMICCVSPADADYSETLNAIRYANRARNIKNKPVINIDPTSLLIADLRKKIQSLANELLLCRSQPTVHHETVFSDDALKLLVSNGAITDITKDVTSAREMVHVAEPRVTTSRRSSWSGTDNDQSNMLAMIKLEKQIVAFTERERTNMSSIKFYSDKCDRLQSQLVEHAEELLRAQSERDFFKIKLQGITSVQSSLSSQRNEGHDVDDSQLDVISGYIKQIKDLNKVIANLQMQQSEDCNQSQNADSILETELTSNIAKLFHSTEKQLINEKKILRRIESCANEDDFEASDEDSAVELEEHGDTVEVQDKLYNHRTKLINAEVLDISESIHFKEELVHQLHQSQKQYEAMQEFYESKLESLCKEMTTKELEKQKVVNDLRDASLSLQQQEHYDDDHSWRDREVNLKRILVKKEAELKSLKKQQTELANLSKVQARSFDQIKTLEMDIVELKRQRVSLTKSLQQEKKVFLTSLSAKAKEIDKLKRELSSAILKMTKLGKEKEQSKQKINQMLQEESVRRKKFAEMRKDGRNKGKGPGQVAPTPRSTRRLLQSLMSAAYKSGGLSIDEQKTRSWVEANIRHLVEREEALEDLSVQCEQQLVLLHSKKDLEDSKLSLFAQSPESEDLSEIEAAITKVANQLKFRNTEISRKKSEIDSSASFYLTKEQITQQLCNSVGKSSSEIQKIVNVLFEIILSGQKRVNSKSSKLQESIDKQRSLQLELEDAVDKLNIQSSTYHREIARIEKEYQSRMMGLFKHSGFHELIQSNTQRSSDLTQSQLSVENGTRGATNVGRQSPNDEYSGDGFKALFAVAEERNSTLQSQLYREEVRVQELETFADECNIERRLVHEKYESKCQENCFLEEECRMLREIVNDLKSDPAGHRGSFSTPQASPHASEDCIEFEDETESVLGQYSMLREEINNTGSAVRVPSGESTGASNTIFDRLTNPSYFTGTQKNIFKKDVEVNRAKVQQMKGDSNKKERKKKEGYRNQATTESEGWSEQLEDSTLYENSWLDSSFTGERGERTTFPYNSPSMKMTATSQPPSRSPNNLNDNVFSRLLNPNKFTGIHRRQTDSPGVDTANIDDRT